MKVCFNGLIKEESSEHSVSVFSEVLQFGRAVFETLRTYDSDRVFALDEHLDRLFQSGEVLKLDLGKVGDRGKKSGIRSQKSEELKIKNENVGTQYIASKELRNIIRSSAQDLVKHNRQEGKDLRIKIFLTEEFFWIRTVILEEMPEAFYSDGVVVDDTVFERNFPRAKYPNLAYKVLAKDRPERYWDTLCFSHDGFLREGTISNVFAIIDAKIVTPEKGILLGVTRQKVLEVAHDLELETEEREVLREELLRADEIFLTCTSKEVVPVRQWGDWMSEDFRVANRLREIFPRK